MPFSGRPLFAFTGLFLGLSLSSPLYAQHTEGAPTNGPASRFAVPGSADSVSRGGKGPSAPDLKKSKKRSRQKGEARPRPDAAVATFPGFRLLPDGRSRIYVELSKMVKVEEHLADQALTFTLRDAQVLVKNNKNPLITTHFATPVSRARLVPAGADLNLVLDLRKAAHATHQVVPGENGSSRLEIDFPAGDYPLEPGRFEPPVGTPYRGKRSHAGGELEAPDVIDDVPPAATPKSSPREPNGVGPPTP